LTHIIVPPACIRPTVKEGELNVRHDDLTVKIRDFLDRNNRYGKKKKENFYLKEEMFGFENVLIFHKKQDPLDVGRR